MADRSESMKNLVDQVVSGGEPKKRKASPGKLPKRPVSKELHNRTRVGKDTITIANLTKAIVRGGGSVPDVGMILACQEDEGGWLDELVEQGLTIDEFLEVAKNRVDMDLVRAAAKAAMGYDYEEVQQVYEPGREGQECPGRKTIKKKKQPGDTSLLKFLLISRMPQYFQDRKSIEINKRVVEIKADAEDEIKSFAAGLLQAFGEPVEAEFVDRRPLDE